MSRQRNFFGRSHYADEDGPVQFELHSCTPKVALATVELTFEYQPCLDPTGGNSSWIDPYLAEISSSDASTAIKQAFDSSTTQSSSDRVDLTSEGTFSTTNTTPQLPPGVPTASNNGTSSDRNPHQRVRVKAKCGALPAPIVCEFQG